LWKHRDFCRLWGGETVEWFTDNITALALPTLAIKIFNAGPMETGVLRALDYVAWPILGLYAGVMVDRWRRKPVLVWTNIIQVVALGSIPAAFLLSRQSLYQLFLVALVMSITSVFFAVAYQAYLPKLIQREDLVEGNSKLETSSSAATVAGPTIAGALYQLIGPLSIAVDSFGTLVAAMMIFSIRKLEPPPPTAIGRRFSQELKAGVKVVVESPTLRSLAASTSVLNFGNSMFMAVFYLFVYERLLISPVLAGIVLGVGGIGLLVGSLVSPRLLKRLGLGTVLTLALLINGLGLLAVQASIFGPAAIMLAALWFLWSIGLPIYNINQVSFRQTIVPDAVQGRMNATMRSIGYGAVALGALVGGVVGLLYGILSAMTTGALISLIPVLVIWFGPVGRLREIPQTGH
jgi:predicted MFS family arabinose efflux permease